MRTEQARELDEYIKLIADDKNILKAVFQPDYSSTAAFEKSAELYRKAFCDSIGYPPPGDRPAEGISLKEIGRDSIAVYYRAMIPILPGVHSEGIYIIPKTAQGKAPLVISMHGGGGSPEVALFNGGSNYNDMVRGAAKRGYVVYAPQHLFRAEGYPGDIRRRIDDRMRLIGTSITAVEIAKITYAIDELVKRPEVDPKRIAMVGLSYGGFYAQVTPAIDTRIKVSVSSCYFGVQEYRYERDELSVPTDFRFPSRFTLFDDADKVALIAPRAHQIQAGASDNDSHRAKGAAAASDGHRKPATQGKSKSKRTEHDSQGAESKKPKTHPTKIAPRARAFYEKLKLRDRFEHVIFDGGHEFDDESAWRFVEKHL